MSKSKNIKVSISISRVRARQMCVDRFNNYIKKPNKMAEGNRSLSVFFEVRRSPFHRHSKGGNDNKKTIKTKQKVSQISNCHFYYCPFMGGVLGGVRGPVRRGIHGPGVGSPGPSSRWQVPMGNIETEYVTYVMA